MAIELRDSNKILEYDKEKYLFLICPKFRKFRAWRSKINVFYDKYRQSSQNEHDFQVFLQKNLSKKCGTAIKMWNISSYCLLALSRQIMGFSWTWFVVKRLKLTKYFEKRSIFKILPQEIPIKKMSNCIQNLVLDRLQSCRIVSQKNQKNLSIR